MPIAELETTAGVMRVWGDGGFYGEPYTFACAFRTLDSETIELLGITRAPTRAEVAAMHRACGRRGFRWVMTCRFKHGRLVKNRRRVRPNFIG